MATLLFKLRNAISRFMEKGRCQNGVQQAADKCCYVFEKYVMPATYVLIVVIGLYSAQNIIIPRLPSLEYYTSASACPKSRFFCHQASGISFPPRTYPWAVPVYIVIAMSSWLLVMFTDPGTLTPGNLRQLSFAYKYDNVLFESKTCRTCHLQKIARSKHCSLCNRCVARFDHHCGWVGTCVGFYNTKYFVIFLALHTFMVAHGAVLCAEILRARMQELIRKRYIYVPTNEVIKSFSFRIAIAAETVVSLFLVVLILLFIMTGSFLGYHVYLIARNTTTNETAKWTAVRKAVRQYAQDHGKTLAEAMKQEARQDYLDGNEKALEELPEFGEDGIPINAYNHGLRANAWEVFAPVSYLRYRTQEAFKSTVPQVASKTD